MCYTYLNQFFSLTSDIVTMVYVAKLLIELCMTCMTYFGNIFSGRITVFLLHMQMILGILSKEIAIWYRYLHIQEIFFYWIYTMTVIYNCIAKLHTPRRGRFSTYLSIYIYLSFDGQVANSAVFRLKKLYFFRWLQRRANKISSEQCNLKMFHLFQETIRHCLFRANAARNRFSLWSVPTSKSFIKNGCIMPCNHATHASDL